MASTSQAAPRCEPSNRDLRPSRFGSCRSRITANVTRPISTPTATRSSRKPTNAQCPMTGIANVRLNRAPYASIRVRNRMTKPQKTRKCAAPGTDQRSSLRCPKTSVSCVSAPRPGCSRSAAIRSGAGWPALASR